MAALHLLSGGAALGLVRGLQAEFEASQGLKIEGTFGAVGAMRDKLLAGAPCDLVILTEALVRELAAQGQVDGGTARPLGVVKTGVALPQAAPDADVGTPAALQALLSGSGAIYFPDPAKATAGIHFMKVLEELGLADAMSARLRTFPNGATAMAALVQAPEANPVGCTQVTEILYAEGVKLTGLLPPPFELATTYTAAVCTKAQDPSAARALVALLAGGAAAPLRSRAGFL
ncbi:MAG: substrate-binding domain-containing protein [Burkholderiales bacterium]|nr:substrate-binding domain-containing protein [Burkholderiales bacterium]